ncbi:MAG: hypothetical protein KGD70_00930 [Candidatus Lokiarchaeota archaeon]|jgi:hypothetical protein|nr:hypothetical protein [Candidatus Lokiarchaeota archaeon]
MEIEKTRETSWKIQLKNKNESIELTSVEVSGEVRILKLTLLKNGDSLVVEMRREEFFNFLSLISAFKDVIIGEDQITMIESLNSKDLTLERKTEPEKSEFFRIEPEDEEKTLENKETNELNPEEWDPW